MSDEQQCSYIACDAQLWIINVEVMIAHIMVIYQHVRMQVRFALAAPGSAQCEEPSQVQSPCILRQESLILNMPRRALTVIRS